MENKDTLFDEIPTDWELTELKDVGDFQYGYTTSAEEDKTDVKFLRITDIEDDGTIKWNKVPYCSVNQDVFKKYELNEGDIVFARLGATSGKTGFIGQNGLKSIFASYLIRLKVHDDINSKLIFYMAQSSIYWSQVLRQREGQLKKGMNANMLSHIKIPLPKDISEQKKIAKILSTIDQSIKKSDEIITKTERMKKGMIQKLLTVGIGHDEFKDTPIGNIPLEWDFIRIKELVKSYAGGTPLRSVQSYYNGTILWVKSGEVDQKRIYDTGEKITEEGLKHSSAKIVPKNSVLIAMYGATAGKVGILKAEGTTNQAVLALPPSDDRYYYEFIYYMLSLNTRRLVGITQGTGQPNLSKQIIDNVKIALPPIEEQYKIAQMLSKIDKLHDKQVERKEKLKNIKKGLMNDLLTGRKRVQVNN